MGSLFNSMQITSLDTRNIEYNSIKKNDLDMNPNRTMIKIGIVVLIMIIVINSFGWYNAVGGNVMKTTLYILAALLAGQIFAQTKKAEDFGFRRMQTICQGDTSL